MPIFGSPSTDPLEDDANEPLRVAHATLEEGSESAVESDYPTGFESESEDIIEQIAEEMATVIEANPRAAIVPTALTLGNLVAGLAACWIAAGVIIRGGVDDQDLVRTISFLLWFGMFCDAFDGYAARRLNVVTRYGAKLDSIADSIGFGVAPALLAWAVDDFATAPVAAAYAVAAFWRLARFTAKPPVEAKSSWCWFRGLPTPGAAMLVLLGAWFGFAGWAALVAGVLMVVPLPCPHIGRLFLGTGRET